MSDSTPSAQTLSSWSRDRTHLVGTCSLMKPSSPLPSAVSLSRLLTRREQTQKRLLKPRARQRTPKRVEVDSKVWGGTSLVCPPRTNSLSWLSGKLRHGQRA